ncbi:hypothetical protein [Azospirillum rugosum]|uniref:Uncharacterized protein n=1 Tax=Azospirillum rugosum TaxID=416170 RepID=A0ABS4SIW5_9PROT|nr:hypothetical protein [Azospirillum rugosum]MBP2292013.1 hypothetical protein [Azospirillum rugosum]MDQ0525851.1 hypothetical protein [Azospirillum rugosum]
MLRLALPAFGPVAAILLLTAAPAGAENLACQSVNGKTVCSRGTLSCQTLNDKTTCTTGPGVLSCETVNGNTSCRRSSAQPDLKPLTTPPMPQMPSLAPSARPTPDRPFGRKAPFEEDARIDEDTHGLTVRVGQLVASID